MAFKGFARDAMGFWHELATEMNREWFLANKERYERTWVEPMTELLTEASAKLATAYRPLKLAPPKVMRIHRDVRFSKDKAPYKTWIGAGVAVGGGKLSPHGGATALYAHFGAEEEFVGAGQYVFADDTLVRWRKLVAGKKGEDIAKIVATLRKKGYDIAAYETMTRVPQGYDPVHPRADLLRMKGLVAGFPSIPRGLIHKPAFLTWVVRHAKTVAPLSIWVAKYLR
jgi:uncharacterized protein (TIGR02453 family)